MSDHGMILKAEHVDYGDLKKFGSVTVTYSNTPQQCGLHVEVKGFAFGDSVTCREKITKAMAWARDVLDAAVRVDTLAPGGQLIAVDATEPMSEDEIKRLLRGTTNQ